MEVQDFSRGHFRGPRDQTQGPFAFQIAGWTWLRRRWNQSRTDRRCRRPRQRRPPRLDCHDLWRHHALGRASLVLVNNLDTESIGKSGDPINHAFRAMMQSVSGLPTQTNLSCSKVKPPNFRVRDFTQPNCFSQIPLVGSCFRNLQSQNHHYRRPGSCTRMAVTAIRELGFRNNGISSARKAIAIGYGLDWTHNGAAYDAIKQAAVPAVLYDRFLATANGWFSPRFKPLIPMYLVVHLTGGAIKSNFAEDILFPRGLSAHLDNLWDPPVIMQNAAMARHDRRGMLRNLEWWPRRPRGHRRRQCSRSSTTLAGNSASKRNAPGECTRKPSFGRHDQLQVQRKKYRLV